MKIGGEYNFIEGSEKLVYLGKEGCWNQFALVSEPNSVWAEVLDCDLQLIQETKDSVCQ
jgi:hypothetical protein